VDQDEEAVPLLNGTTEKDRGISIVVVVGDWVNNMNNANLQYALAIRSYRDVSQCSHSTSLSLRGFALEKTPL
jgi:hypothetical protein